MFNIKNTFTADDMMRWTNFSKDAVRYLPSVGFLINTYTTQRFTDAPTLDFATAYEWGTIAPFVHPYSMGTPVDNDAYKVQSVSLPYVKHTDSLDISRIHHAYLLDPSNYGQLIEVVGNINAAAVRTLGDANLAEASIRQKHTISIGNRREKMCCDFLLHGKVATISSMTANKYNGSIFDYGRDASLSYTVANADLFDTAGSDPWKTIQEGLSRLNNMGMVDIELICGNKVINALMKNTAFKDIWLKMTPYASKPQAPFLMPNYNVLSYNIPCLAFGNVVLRVYNQAVKSYNYDSVADDFTLSDKYKFIPDDALIFIGKKATGGVIQHPILNVSGPIQNMNVIKQYGITKGLEYYQSKYTNLSGSSDMIETEASPMIIGDPNCAMALKVISDTAAGISPTNLGLVSGIQLV